MPTRRPELICEANPIRITIKPAAHQRRFTLSSVILTAKKLAVPLAGQIVLNLFDLESVLWWSAKKLAVPLAGQIVLNLFDLERRLWWSNCQRCSCLTADENNRETDSLVDIHYAQPNGKLEETTFGTTCERS